MIHTQIINHTISFSKSLPAHTCFCLSPSLMLSFSLPNSRDKRHDGFILAAGILRTRHHASRIAICYESIMTLDRNKSRRRVTSNVICHRVSDREFQGGSFSRYQHWAVIENWSVSHKEREKRGRRDRQTERKRERDTHIHTYTHGERPDFSPVHRWLIDIAWLEHTSR